MSVSKRQAFAASRQEILADSRTFAYQLFRALPDTAFGLRLLHLMARPPRILWPRSLQITCHQIAGRSTGQRISLWVLAPRESKGNLPVVLHLHGGGFAIGAPEQDFRLLAMLVDASPCIIVAPAYRLSLVRPYPAGFHDAAASLEWAIEKATTLGGDQSRLFVMGQSAGGGLAAALSLWVRDTRVTRLSGQLLIGAMLDNRTEDSPEGRQILWSWAPKRNRLAWNLYLRDISQGDAERSYAVPARRDDMSGVAPAYGVVGAADLFFTENNTYFGKLENAGVPSSLSVIPNAYHGVEVLAPKSIAGREFLNTIRELFKSMLTSPAV